MTHATACPFCGQTWVTLIKPRNGRHYAACNCGVSGPAANSGPQP